MCTRLTTFVLVAGLIVAASASVPAKPDQIVIRNSADTDLGRPILPPVTTPDATLTVVGNRLVNGLGATVVLRGLASMGMGMVYGDKANPGTYLPMTNLQYVDRALQTDSTGNVWYVNAIRLNFERFPSVNPARLYSTENQPYAMPDTITFTAWQASHAYQEGDIAFSGGSRYVAKSRQWRADKGAAWNLPHWAVNDVAVFNGNVYRCTAVVDHTGNGTGVPDQTWGQYPQGTTTWHENQGQLEYDWLYIGAFGQSGSSQPFGGTPVTEYTGTYYFDNLVQWQYMSPDYSAPTALANWLDWKAKVMDPPVVEAIAKGLYVVVCDFDFGPAHHPLRHARMYDFWDRISKDPLYKNNPQVIFELWNESEDIGTFAGGPDSWASQKPAIQETIDKIRANGATNVIISPTPFYSSWIGEATASPLTGSNIAYALHQYRIQWDSYQSNRDQITQGLASGKPIIMTEWGDDSNSDPNLLWPSTSGTGLSLRQLLEPSNGVNAAAGWFAWALTNTWSPNLFSNNGLTNPTPFGVATRQWLSETVGSNPPPPPVDLCSNIAGVQTTVPAGYVQNVDGTCTLIPPPNGTLVANPDTSFTESQASGVWVNVTPAAVDLTSNLDCGNAGLTTVGFDPLQAKDLYFMADCQGIWKSTNGGQTWTGPITTGTHPGGAKGAGGLAVGARVAGSPYLYVATIRPGGGDNFGFWRSADGGVNFNQVIVPVLSSAASDQDYYPVELDPYDHTHLLMQAHEANAIAESFDTGLTWSAVPMNAGMNEQGGTGFGFFIDMGSAAPTRTAFLWLAQQSGGTYGTWRTTNHGTTWTKVDSNEHPHGASQLYQPGNGVIYMAGVYSALGWGVLRSANYGVSWTHVGGTSNEAVVWGTPNRVYAAYCWSLGLSQTISANFESAPQPGITGWTNASQPSGMIQAAAQTATIHNTTNGKWVTVSANKGGGIWRYVE